jgi:nucleoside-diphosphate-sugar epimerase
MSVPYMLAESEQQPGVDVEFLEPDQVYGWSKLVGEVLAAKLRETGVPVTVVRPFSGYGTDQDPTYPFPAFIARAKAREDPFTVWGDGHQTRDFIHVDDVVNGTLAAVDQGVDGPLNLCTGRPVSFGVLAMEVCRQAGYLPDFHYATDQPTGVRYRVGDPTRMLEVYQPKVTLEEGIRRALEEDR